MSASHIRADMFSEFIGTRPDGNGTTATTPRKTTKSASILQRQLSEQNRISGSETREPNTESDSPSNQSDRIALADSNTLTLGSTIQERPLMQLLQALADHKGKMCIKSLLQSQEGSKLETLRLLDQLEKLEFVAINSEDDLDIVRLTTLGSWAAKYAD